MVTGRLGDIREKYLVEMATLLMVTLSFSELVAVTSRVFAGTCRNGAEI